MSDPVLWARAFLISNNAATKKYGPWEARDYQAEMLRDHSLRKVYRCGRRCLPAYVRIMNPRTGELVRVGQLFVKKKANVLSMDKEYDIQPRLKCPVTFNGEKEVFSVALSGGREIDATDNHPFFTPDGWKELKDLKLGDYVAVPRIIDFFGKEEIKDYEVKLLACMAASSNIISNTIKIPREPGTKVFQAVRDVFRNFGCDITEQVAYNTYRIEENEEKKLTGFLKLHKYGFVWKEIPSVIFKLKKDQVKLFLSYLYMIGGYTLIHYPGGRRAQDVEIIFSSSSDYLSHQLMHLLLRFGIDSSLERSRGKWNVIIHRKEDILNFAAEIGIYGEEYSLGRCVKEMEKKESISPVIPDRGKFTFKKIMRIESVGKHKTYDLHVPEYHNFIANDILVHNTGKTEVMVVEGLWKAFTNKNYRILYVTPYETQVNLIFMRIKELIYDSPLVKDQVVRMINSPYMIELKNGSIIMGFTTGASSGSGAASVK